MEDSSDECKEGSLCVETTAQDNTNNSSLSPTTKRYKMDSHDPFPSRLRCESLPFGQSPKQILWWYSPHPYIPIEAEEAILPIVLRWGANERKMMKDQPNFRLPQIQKKCHQYQIPLLVALSLRRHHMKRLNPYCSMERLQLGDHENIRISANLFERAVENALRQHNLTFYTEQDQKQHNATKRLPDEPYPPTPDFILKQPILLRKYKDDHKDDRQQRKHSRKREIIEERVIHWIEVKMFYGASTIEHDGKSAVGSIIEKCRRYVDLYGEGAVMFLYGCGDKLAHDLAEIRVSVMDSGGAITTTTTTGNSSTSRNRLSLHAMEEHQRSWCGDKYGNILL